MSAWWYAHTKYEYKQYVAYMYVAGVYLQKPPRLYACFFSNHFNHHAQDFWIDVAKKRRAPYGLRWKFNDFGSTYAWNKQIANHQVGKVLLSCTHTSSACMWMPRVVQFSNTDFMCDTWNVFETHNSPHQWRRDGGGHLYCPISWKELPRRSWVAQRTVVAISRIHASPIPFRFFTTTVWMSG